MEQATVIDKVRKLMALAERSTYPAEAENAMLQAQRLMVTHDLSASDVEVVEEAEIQAVESVTVDEMRWKQDWRGWLATVVAHNHRCEVVWSVSHMPFNPHPFYRLRFFGFTADSQIAAAVYGSAIKAITRMVRVHLDERKAMLGKYGMKIEVAEAMRARTSFIAGFIVGLEDKYRVQVEQNNWALVLVTPGAVREAVSDARPQKRSSQTDYTDHFARKAGYKAGQDFNGPQPELTAGD